MFRHRHARADRGRYSQPISARGRQDVRDHVAQAKSKSDQAKVAELQAASANGCLRSKFELAKLRACGVFGHTQYWCNDRETFIEVEHGVILAQDVYRCLTECIEVFRETTKDSIRHDICEFIDGGSSGYPYKNQTPEGAMFLYFYQLIVPNPDFYFVYNYLFTVPHFIDKQFSKLELCRGIRTLSDDYLKQANPAFMGMLAKILSEVIENEMANDNWLANPQELPQNLAQLTRLLSIQGQTPLQLQAYSSKNISVHARFYTALLDFERALPYVRKLDDEEKPSVLATLLYRCPDFTANCLNGWQDRFLVIAHLLFSTGPKSEQDKHLLAHVLSSLKAGSISADKSAQPELDALPLKNYQEFLTTVGLAPGESDPSRLRLMNIFAQEIKTDQYFQEIHYRKVHYCFKAAHEYLSRVNQSAYQQNANTVLSHLAPHVSNMLSFMNNPAKKEDAEYLREELQSILQPFLALVQALQTSDEEKVKAASEQLTKIIDTAMKSKPQSQMTGILSKLFVPKLSKPPLLCDSHLLTSMQVFARECMSGTPLVPPAGSVNNV
jgi:hypothetical protein